MRLARVLLLLETANGGTVWTNDDEQVFTVEADGLEVVDDLDMSQPLLVGADLILTLDYADTVVFEDTTRLIASPEVQVGDGGVPFGSALGGLAI